MRLNYLLMARHILAASLFLATLSACEREPLPSADPSSQLITDVIIIDGTGAARLEGSVRFMNAEIISVGDLKARPGERIIDGGGLVLAPGFIDTHSHVESELFEQPGALAAVSQGITTAIIGQDGDSPFPLLDFRFRLIENPAAINIASFSGHNSIRGHVMGKDFRRRPSNAEMSIMEQFLKEDLATGALGLSTGLEYNPGIYSDIAEVIALASVAASQGGRYTSHVRSEDRWFEQAIDEIIEIGREAEIPVHVSHIKLAMTSLWGRAPEILAKMDAARSAGIDISAEIYPYEYWQSGMMVLLPQRDITDRAEVEFALTEISPPDGLWFTQFDPRPDLVGKTLTEAAEMLGTDPVSAFMTLIAESEAMSEETGKSADMIIGTSMREEDIKALMSWPHSSICTDGSLNDLHPRGIGTFPRVLGRYVREQGLMSLEEAIHRMTGLSAQNMGLKDRGIIAAGAAADFVLFDPKTIIDNATLQDPSASNTGISKVWVSGRVVYENGQETGRRPGKFIARADM